MTIFQALSRLSSDYFNAMLKSHGKKIRERHEFYPNEIDPAVELIRHLKQGSRSVLMAQPMQSGKTNIISATTLILRALIPDLRAVYICANDQLDFRRQNHLELAPHVEVLTRKDRRKWLNPPGKEPLIVFYDESHFGDGSNMTVSQFLCRHKVLDNPNAVFCGVSATPFTSIGCLESTIWPDMDGLHNAGYNSPKLMLDNGRIKDAEPMFFTPSRRALGRTPLPEDVVILEECEAYRHLEEVIKRPTSQRTGYCMIRCKRREAEALEGHLSDRWGRSVYVVHWNQHNRDFSPKEFFEKRRPDVVTVVLVQDKARMGNVISTDQCHFFYEYSPRANVDTIAQSFIGRACGFEKQHHTAIVYSRCVIAEAYVIAISGREEVGDFSLYCSTHKLKAASRTRTNYNSSSYNIELLETFKMPQRCSSAMMRRKSDHLVKKFGLKPRLGSIRTLSLHKDPYRNILSKDIEGPSHEGAAVRNLQGEPGSWAIVIIDGVKSKTGKLVEKFIQLAIRGSTLIVNQTKIGPIEETIAYGIRERTLGRGQMSLALNIKGHLPIEKLKRLVG